MTAPPLDLRDRPLRTRYRLFKSPGSRSDSADRVMRKMAEAKTLGRQWKRSHRTRVVVTDSIIVVAAVAIAQLGRFGLPEHHGLQLSHDWLYLTAYSIGLAVIWIAALGVQASCDLSLAGIGSEEYRRVVTATASVFGFIAVTDLLLQVGIVRGYLAIALPAGLAGLLVG